MKIAPQLAEVGYSIAKIWFGYKIFYSNRKIIEGTNYSYPSIDVFIVDQIDGKYRFYYKKARNTWPREYWSDKELFPITKYKFGEIIVMGPNQTIPYLDRAYKDWNKIAYRQYDHSKEEDIVSVKVRLTADMREPARPTKVKDNSKVHSATK